MKLDPYIARAIEIAYAKGHGQLAYASVDDVRAYYKSRFKAETTVEYEQEIQFEDKARLRIYRHSKASHLPLIIYLRASAFVLGSIEESHVLCELLSKKLNAIVVAMEPNLAPEYPFPRPFDDCVEMATYLLAHQNELGFNQEQIGLWGESSGGTLAAALANHLNQRSPIIKAQILFYPMLDAVKTMDYESVNIYGQGHFMDVSLMDWFLQHYLPSNGLRHDPRVSPLLAPSFQHLPMTHLFAAGCDPVRDENIRYYEQLLSAGVPTSIQIYEGMTHGFLWFANRLKIARQALLEGVVAMNKALQA